LGLKFKEKDTFCIITLPLIQYNKSTSTRELRFVDVFEDSDEEVVGFEIFGAVSGSGGVAVAVGAGVAPFVFPNGISPAIVKG